MSEREIYLDTRSTAAGHRRPVGSGEIDGFITTTPPPLPEEYDRCAVRYAASASHGGSDARELLDCLGIADRELLESARRYRRNAGSR